MDDFRDVFPGNTVLRKAGYFDSGSGNTVKREPAALVGTFLMIGMFVIDNNIPLSGGIRDAVDDDEAGTAQSKDKFKNILMFMYISGAAGGIGTTMVQMAKASGIRVIASASNAEKCTVLRQLGADTVFNYKEEDEKEVILDATNGIGADVIYDQTAGKELAGKLDYLADFGQIILYNWLNGSPELPQLETIIKCAWHAQAIRSFSFHVYDNKKEKRLANAAKCFDMIRDGRVKPYVCKDFPLTEAKAAHELLDSGKAIGKIIMHP